MATQSTQHQHATTYKSKTLPMTRLPDENVLVAWEGRSSAEELIVTTHRVQHSRRGIGRRSKTNIMLDSISSCSLEFRSRVRYIVFAVVAIILGLLFAADNGSAPMIGGVVAGLF